MSMSLPFATFTLPLSATCGEGPVESEDALSSSGLLSSTWGSCELTAHMNCAGSRVEGVNVSNWFIMLPLPLTGCGLVLMEVLAPTAPGPKVWSSPGWRLLKMVEKVAMSAKGKGCGIVEVDGGGCSDTWS
jgi:hypothetical protein